MWGGTLDVPTDYSESVSVATWESTYPAFLLKNTLPSVFMLFLVKLNCNSRDCFYRKLKILACSIKFRKGNFYANIDIFCILSVRK